jgi:hypothetical protein
MGLAPIYDLGQGLEAGPLHGILDCSTCASDSDSGPQNVSNLWLKSSSSLTLNNIGFFAEVSTPRPDNEGCLVKAEALYLSGFPHL